MGPWTTYDGTESPALKRYERTVDALSLFTASVRADGLSFADAFMRHLSDIDIDIDSDADIPPAATPAWRRFLANHAGVPDPAGAHLSECRAKLAALSVQDAAAELSLLDEVQSAAQQGLEEVEAQNAAAWSAALDSLDLGSLS